MGLWLSVPLGVLKFFGKDAGSKGDGNTGSLGGLEELDGLLYRVAHGVPTARGGGTPDGNMSLQNPALDIHHDTAALAQWPDSVRGPATSLEYGKEGIGIVFEEVVFGGNARVEFSPLLQSVE